MERIAKYSPPRGWNILVKLKTLKDLSYGLNHIPNSHCNPVELREEAIRHVKAKIKRIEEHSHKKYVSDGDYMDCLQCRNHFVQIQWIRYFFNIANEELK